VFNNAGIWEVQGDVNGDGVADLIIRIANGNAITFVASDFLL
jgi:hypothetical protein